MKEANHKKPHFIRLHSYEIPRRGKSIETENRLAVAEGWGGEGRLGW